MSSTKQITWQYIDFIADKVIDKFGGSYQNKGTLGKTWRQQMEYQPDVEKYVIWNSKLFLDTHVNVCDRGNLNMMYKVCYNMAEHLSKYLIKRSPDLTREGVTNDLLQDLFFDNKQFITRFEKAYKRPISMDDENYVKYNPGVVAMAKALEKQKF